MVWFILICLSAVLVLGAVGLVRWTKLALVRARTARLAALDERMKKGYRIKMRAQLAIRPRPPKKS